MTLLMLPPDRSGDDQPDTPPTGRVPTGEHIPQAWRGIGGLMGERPPAGNVYGRPRRRALKRALKRLGWLLLVLVVLAVAVAAAVAAALLRILVL